MKHITRHNTNHDNESVNLMQDKTILMRANKFLSAFPVLITCVFFISTILFFLMNYLVNCINNIPLILQNFDTPAPYLGANNFITFSSANWIWYIIMAIIISIVDIKFIYEVRVAWKDYNVGQKGTERFATMKEIEAQYPCVDEKDTLGGVGGIPVSRKGNKIFVDDSNVNNLVIGITRSGKDETFVKPTIDIYSRSKDKPSMVITDPKLETIKASAETLKKRGYDVYLLNLQDPSQSMGYNPLTPIVNLYKEKKYGEAELLAHSLAYSIFCANKSGSEDKFWDSSSAFASTALFLALIDDCLKADKIQNEKNKKAATEEAMKIATAKYNAVLEKESPKNLEKIKNIQDIKKAKEMKHRDGTPFTQQDVADYTGIPSSTVSRLWNEKAITKESFLPLHIEYKETHENEKKITLYSVAHTFSQLSSVKVDKDKSALDDYFLDRPTFDRARYNYSSISVAGDRTKGSILSVTLSEINKFAMGSIAEMTATNDFDLLDLGFGEKPVALFIGIQIADSSNSHMASMLIKQSCAMLFKKASLSKESNGHTKRPVKFILNEFGNIPKVDDMAKYITAGLGVGLSYTIIVQDFGQLRALYGDETNTIMSNCGNKIYLLSDDNDTNKEFSEKLGSETITTINRVGQKMSTNKSITEMYDGRELLKASELAHLQQGQSVIMRVMKRTDLEGNDIYNAPIFNKEDDNKFKFAYTYLQDTFPSNRSLEDLDLILHPHYTDDELIAISFDVEKYLKEKEYNDFLKTKLEVYKDSKPVADVIDFLSKKYKKSKSAISKLSLTEALDSINNIEQGIGLKAFTSKHLLTINTIINDFKNNSKGDE